MKVFLITLLASSGLFFLTWGAFLSKKSIFLGAFLIALSFFFMLMGRE